MDRASAEVVADARFSSGARGQGAHAPARFYLPELDLLRFLAWLTIFLQHIYQETPAHHFPDFHPDWVGRAVGILGWSGGYSIDLFLALSAFLITQLMIREQQVTGTVDLRRFYIRRILRIWPLYFSYVLVIAVAGIWIASMHASAKWLIMATLLSSNIANSLWGWTPAFVVSHLWTISIEEQFYLLWPLVVRRSQPSRLVLAALAMLAISFTTRTICWFTNASGALVWTNTLTRLDPLAVGILLAVWMMGGGHYHRRMVSRVALLLFGIATILVVATFCDPFWSPNSTATIFFGYPAVALGCGTILLAFCGMPLRENNPLIQVGIYLGKISYGLYIWQMVALVVVMKGLARPLPLVGSWIDSATFIALCAFTLTVAMAAVSYRFLETPFLRLKSRFALIPSRPA